MNDWHVRCDVALLFGVALVACDPGGPREPEPVVVPVNLVAPKGPDIAGPIRVAVVWKQGSGQDAHWLSTFDAELPKVPESTKVLFDLPARSERAALSDVRQAYVSCDEQEEMVVSGPAASPRLVAYQDLDASGDFDPNLPSHPGNDRVLAVTPSSNASQYIAAFTDLDGMLSKAPMEYAECVRGFTGNQYSAFFSAYEYSDYLWAQTGTLSARLELAPNPFAAVTMGCTRSDVYSMINQWSQITKSQSTRVDARLDPNPCTNSPWQCSAVDVGGLDVPTQTASVTYPGFLHYYSCTAVGELDVLWFEEGSIDCTGCACDWLMSRQTWVVNAANAPTGWPCGKVVNYCGERRASIWEAPSYCSTSTLTRPN